MAKASNKKATPKAEAAEEFTHQATTGQADSFDNWLAAAANTKEAENITQGAFQRSLPLYNNSLIKCAIVAVEPLKNEVEEVQSEVSTINQDVRTMVPWLAGIAMRLLVLKIRNMVPDPVNPDALKAEVTDTFEYDPETKLFTFPCGFKNIRQREQVRAADINEGRVRVYDPNHRSEKAIFPEHWAEMSPRERFIFWSVVLGKKYGLSSLQPGTTFYAYVSRQKREYQGKDRYFTNLYKTMRDDVTKNVYEANWETGMMDPEILLALDEKIGEEWDREMAAKSNVAAMGGDTYGGYSSTDNSDVPF